MSLMDVILAFPPLLLALSIVTFRDDRSVPNIVLAIGIVAIPAVARLVRANTMTFREREFVLASRNLGASHVRILLREITPNVIPAVISFAVIGIAVAITAESGLAYLGASVNPPTPTWGGMINAAKNDLTTGQAWQVWIPCIALALTVLALYLGGDRLRRYFDVKESAL
jgi:peptide/nickel transport system permease protein